MVDEFKLYEEIKKSFTVEKGKILMFELTSEDITKLQPKIFDIHEDCMEAVSHCAINHIPYVIFDYMNQEELVYEFTSRRFRKYEVLKTGEILDFDFYGDEKPVTAEDIRKDFEKLKKMLNSKAS